MLPLDRMPIPIRHKMTETAKHKADYAARTGKCLTVTLVHMRVIRVVVLASGVSNR